MLLDSASLPLLALPPLVAIVSAVLWSSSPARQRQPVVRWALITSVSLTAIEVCLAILFLVVLRLMADAEFD